MTVPLGIRVWMAEKDLKKVDISKQYDSSLGFISFFLNGKRTSKKLADFMIEEGCPETCFKNGKVFHQEDK
jgi:hypothetical protein